MKYRKVLSRRTMLKGAGSVAIGLPFLDEMRSTSVYAAEPDAPPRCLTVFFGEGCPINVQTEHLAALTGPFEPLQAVSSKLGFCRGLRFPDEHHYGGGSGCFTGAGTVGDEGAQTMGPSIDTVMRQELYPGGLPGGVQAALSMALVGTYHPDTGAPAVRYVKCWSDTGTPVTIPRFNPGDLFSSIFGSNEELDEAAEKEQRRKRSVLDSVLDQYEFMQSDASNLGNESKARIKDHFDRVREYEERAFGDITGICDVPGTPPDLPLQGAQEHHAGIIYNVDEFQAVWRLMADIYVAGVQCDVIRFGNCHFLNVGDRINFQGDYVYNGNLIYTFDDYGDTPNETELGNHVNHELFHAWGSSGSPIQADHHLHMYMNELAYLFGQLDSGDYLDENGRTILDNALVITTTELSDPGPHLSRDVFHAYSSANERLKVGEMVTAGTDPNWRQAADFYNTILETYGVGPLLGDVGYSRVDEVLA